MAGVVVGVVILLVLIILFVRRRKGALHEPQLPDVTTNPMYTVEAGASLTTRGGLIVVTDSTDTQYSIPMEQSRSIEDELNADSVYTPSLSKEEMDVILARLEGGGTHSAGADAPTPSDDCIEPVARNQDGTYAPPMAPPTPWQGTQADAAAVGDAAAGLARDADGYVVDDFLERDADGYVVDDFVPDGGGGVGGGEGAGGAGGAGVPIVYSTYDASAGAGAGAGAAAEYAVPTEEGPIDQVYAGVDINV